MSQLNVNTIKNRVGNSGPTISGNTTISGILTATSFSGDGSGLTSLIISGDGNLTNLNVSGVSTFTGNTEFDGNVTIGGTLTYRDVTSIDSVGMITARKGVQILADGLTVTGVSTLSNGVSIPDNQYLNIGNDSDLRLYHTSTASFIEDQGTGNFIIGSNGGSLKITKGADTENMAVFTPDGSAAMYYDNVKKFETKTDGVDITGELQCDSLDVEGGAYISGTATLGGITGNVFSTITTTATSKTIINREYCTVTASGQTITLPVSPTSGDQVLISVLEFTDTVIGRNGQNIMGLAEDCTINTAQSTINLVYIDSSRGWRIS